MSAEPPLTVTGARVLLVVFIALWVFGVFTGGRQLLESANESQMSLHLGRLLLVFTWNISLAIAGAFAFWAVGRRRPVGRWVTVGLFAIVIYRMLSSLLYAWRAANGDLAPPGELSAYSSPDEAKRSVFFSLVLFGAIGAQTFLLARGKAANRYFGSPSAPAEASHRAGQS